MEKTFIFTGGGSGGHVMPALTLINELKKDPAHQFLYIGSQAGIEKQLAREHGLTYREISTGKLRRYLSLENLKDLFKVLLGILQAFKILMQFNRRECLVVATGGFVIVPVVIAAWLQRKTIILHEQTSRVGLANKIASFFAKRVLVTFESSIKYFNEGKVSLVGYPLREDIFTPARDHFAHIEKPILFITGGGNGSLLINKVIEEMRVELLKDFYIIHQVGKKHYNDFKGYATEEYEVHDFINEHMVDILKEASVIVSRSGAGTVAELMGLGKPSVFIPLKIAQKNEQFHNAMEAHKKVGSIVVEEKDLSTNVLRAAIDEIKTSASIQKAEINPTKVITNILKEDLASL